MRGQQACPLDGSSWGGGKGRQIDDGAHPGNVCVCACVSSGDDVGVGGVVDRSSWDVDRSQEEEDAVE